MGAIKPPEAVDSKLPKFGPFPSKTSKAAPTPVGVSLGPMSIGAGLELFPKLPRFGTFSSKTSKVWNFFPQNFQGLELSACEFPNLGTFSLQTSKAAPTSVRASLAPIFIGAGLELFIPTVPRVGSVCPK